MSKTLVDNILFDSKIEASAYLLFKEAKLDFSLQPEFLLFEPFEYTDLGNKKRKYSKMIYTGDFLVKSDKYDKPIVVEIKGFQRSDYMLRKKLFIMKYNKDYYFIQLNNIKEIIEFTSKLKEI